MYDNKEIDNCTSLTIFWYFKNEKQTENVCHGMFCGILLNLKQLVNALETRVKCENIYLAEPRNYTRTVSSSN